jgi:hypothetical protein
MRENERKRGKREKMKETRETRENERKRETSLVEPAMPEVSPVPAIHPKRIRNIRKRKLTHNTRFKNTPVTKVQSTK